MFISLHLQITFSRITLPLLIVDKRNIICSTSIRGFRKSPIYNTIDMMILCTIWILNLSVVEIYSPVNIYMIIIDRVSEAGRVLSPPECNQVSSTGAKWSFHLVKAIMLLDVNCHSHIKADSHSSPITTCIKELTCTDIIKIDSVHVFIGLISNTTDWVSVPFVVCILSLCLCINMGQQPHYDQNSRYKCKMSYHLCVYFFS
ncbi:hypothetical protein HMPREF9303_1210 [Prevotella denticola CRIS 18C-A]|uniref:Uncharacterized protein n=1 Tax=Prevotella denticola CRIS 18C-A TaxID=944557 RepID=F0H6E3_9BACT|nr:hypothetical protein HMPREF9303_1210 [Prevotella denticola CRIS 18C-A]